MFSSLLTFTGSILWLLCDVIPIGFVFYFGFFFLTFCGFIILGINFSLKGLPLSELIWLPRLIFKTPGAPHPQFYGLFSSLHGSQSLPSRTWHACSFSLQGYWEVPFLSPPLRGPSPLLRPEQVSLLCISLDALYSTYHAPLQLPSHVSKSVTFANLKRATHCFVHTV